jgi:Tol biopolymer transport system component
LGNLNGHAGTWSPDGQRIIYATRGLTDSYDDLYMATKDGSEVRKLIRIEKGGVSFIRWSPDGKVVRMIIWQNYFGSVWEVSADGMNLHPVVLFPGENRIISSMSWTPDGRYFVFDSVKALNSRAWQIWARRETRSVFRGRTAKPVQLTTGAISFWNLALSPDSKHIFADGGQARGELARYDVRLSRLEPFLSGISADQVDFSRDGKWVTYATYPETILWRSRVDGRERMQLTTASHLAVLPRWSPDGTRIAFSGILPGEHSKLYVVSAEGGKPEMVSETQGDEMDPTWSPDGNSLIFGERYGSAQLRISSVDLRTGRISIIPGSEGMFSPRVSPDGRFIVASDSQGNHKQFLFDQETQKWSELMNIIKSTLSWQQWSSDSRSVYVSDLADLHAPVLYRVRIADHKVERVAAFEIPEGVTGNFLSWMGVAPDGSPLLLRDLSIEEIYALDFEAP